MKISAAKNAARIPSEISAGDENLSGQKRGEISAEILNQDIGEMKMSSGKNAARIPSEITVR